MHVVVIQTAFLGDLILSTPLLKQLKERHNCQISLVARKGLGQLLKDLSLVDHFYPIEKGNSQSYKDVSSLLSSQEVDYLICPHESFRSALLAAKMNVKFKKIGFRKWWSPLFFDKSLAKPSELPDSLRQLSLLRLIDPGFDKLWESTDLAPLRNSEVTDRSVDFRNTTIPDWASMRIDKQDCVQEVVKENIVLIAPGSVWKTKKWTEDGFEQTAKAFLARGFDVKLIGSQAEHEVCERVRVNITQIENRAGKDSLAQSLKLMQRSKLLVSNDSGAMHLASLVALPVVTIFGPTVLSLGYRPWNENAIAVQTDLDCRPCGKHGHNECPIGTHECMKSLPSEAVVSAGLSLV